MKVYTKTGDRGTTGLFGGRRVSKANLQVEAYGTLDELSGYLGLIISLLRKNKKEASLLSKIQKDIYQITAHLAGAKVDIVFLQKRTNIFERSIDFYASGLPKLYGFILPGGGEIASFFHISRTVCRRAERRVVEVFKKKKSGEILTIIQYLNRLSDLLFIMARCFVEDKEKTVK